jgi:hypothetical protein
MKGNRESDPTMAGKLRGAAFSLDQMVFGRLPRGLFQGFPAGLIGVPACQNETICNHLINLMTIILSTNEFK